MNLFEIVESFLARELTSSEQSFLDWMQQQEKGRTEQLAQLLQQVHNMGYERGQLSVDIDGVER